MSNVLHCLGSCRRNDWQGVSSGQDPLTVAFISFGAWGLIGVIVLGSLHVGFFGRPTFLLGVIIAQTITVVLAEISHPVIYRADIA